MDNPYSVLGVERTASKEDIKAAYKKKAKMYHPDVNNGSDEMIKKLNSAYDILKDDKKRQEYDYGQANPTSRQYSSRYTEQDMSDIFRDIFGHESNFNRNPFRQQRVNKNVNLTYAISLKEAYTGKTATITYSVSGKNREEIQITIPSGIQDGQSIYFTGKGDNSISGVAPGDLVITIRILEDANFAVNGYDLYTSVNVDYIDAILGTDVELNLIDDSKIKLKIPKKTNPEKVLRISKKGMPFGNTHGDLYVTVMLYAPTLDEDQLEILQKLRS